MADAPPLLPLLPGCLLDEPGIITDDNDAGSSTFTEPASPLTVTAIVGASAYDDYFDESGDESEARVGVIYLHIACPPLCIHISLGEVDRFKPEDWTALTAGQMKSIVLTNSNGEVSVTSNEGQLTFALSRYGGDDNSEISVHGPLALFTRVFDYVSQRVRAIRGMKSPSQEASH